MRVQLRGVDYRIRFEFNQTRRRQTTTAIIEARQPDKTWEPVMTGESHCHPVDSKVYNRTLGKRKALARAFGEHADNGHKHYTISQPDRMAFWTVFNAAHPEKKKEKKPKFSEAAQQLTAPVSLLETLSNAIAAPAYPGDPGWTPPPNLSPGDDDVL